MRKTPYTLIALAALATIALPAAAQDSGSWIVRGRAVSLKSANTNDAQLKATLTSIVGSPSEASINDKTLPEVDISYFFSPNVAAELILTVPQKQDLSVSGVGKIGSFKHLPPTLTAQYHFTNLGAFRPYVGAGINYTNISDTSWTATGTSLGLNLKRNSVGLALQAGVDVPVGGGWLLNLDVKKVQIKTDVLSFNTKVGTFKVDPTLIGIGLGKRF